MIFSQEAFSTLPRVELPGASGWRRLPRIPVPTFSTLPRVELPGATYKFYRNVASCRSFSTLPRVELPGAGTVYVKRSVVVCFQYPTSGRTAWSYNISHDKSIHLCYFQYPTSGRTAWSPCLLVGPGDPVVSFSTLPRVELPGAITLWCQRG